jgi:hypothetical protein
LTRSGRRSNRVPISTSGRPCSQVGARAGAKRTRTRALTWPTSLPRPGMICVSRKARNSTFRNYVAAETAVPTISCCACLGADDQRNFYFAGVARSKSVRPIDDGVGPQIDEVTAWSSAPPKKTPTHSANLSLPRVCSSSRSQSAACVQWSTFRVGQSTREVRLSHDASAPSPQRAHGASASPLLRSRPAHAPCLADVLEWTFCPKGVTGKPGSKGMRGTSNPRRISVKVTTQASERAIGRALSFSKHGDAFDLLLKTA